MFLIISSHDDKFLEISIAIRCFEKSDIYSAGNNLTGFTGLMFFTKKTPGIIAGTVSVFNRFD